MAGEIDFRSLDPSAFYKGAANANDLMQQIAKTRAGKLIAQKNIPAAEDELNNSGNLEEARNVQLNLDEKDERLQKMTDAHRQESTQMIIDAAHVLDRVRAEKGDAAVAPAFEQLVPLFKARGATDQELQTYRQGLQNNPSAFINTIHQIASTHMKGYTLAPGARRFDDDNQLVASAPLPKRTVNTPAGGQLTEYDPNSPAGPVADAVAETLPPEAAQHLLPGHVTEFANGQKWTLGADNNPQRVQ